MFRRNPGRSLAKTSRNSIKKGTSAKVGPCLALPIPVERNLSHPFLIILQDFIENIVGIFLSSFTIKDYFTTSRSSESNFTMFKVNLCLMIDSHSNPKIISNLISQRLLKSPIKSLMAIRHS